MKDVRIIKRYQNRKLYDTFQSCYVTLEEISQIIREGNEIQVIDNKTKKDITPSTQIQLLFDLEKKGMDSLYKTENFNALNEMSILLKRVIRSENGTLSSYIKMLEAKLNIGTEETNTMRDNFFTNPNNTDNINAENNRILN